MKKCQQCFSQRLKSSREDYVYDESGLPHVILHNVEVRRCLDCGDEGVLIPRMAELHRVIALAIIQKPARLTGAEVRYLRTFLDWSNAELSEHMGVDASTVSRWEHDQQVIGPQADRLLRLLVAKEWPEYSNEALKKISDDQRPVRVDARVKDDQWQLSTPVAA